MLIFTVLIFDFDVSIVWYCLFFILLSNHIDDHLTISDKCRILEPPYLSQHNNVSHST